MLKYLPKSYKTLKDTVLFSVRIRIAWLELGTLTESEISNILKVKMLSIKKPNCFFLKSLKFATD